MSAERRLVWGGGALLAGAAALAYSDSWSGPFIFDDPGAILQNPTIRPGARLAALVLGPPGTSAAGRPLVNLSLALNRAISGTEVWSYHGLNLLIHIAAGLVLFGLVRRTLRGIGWAGADGAALAAALLWTLHPLQTESVTYVIQRAESLMGLCYLATLYAFARYAAGGDRAWGALCVTACLLGMGAKEVMVTAPIVVLFYDRGFVSESFRESWQRHRGVYAGLAATWLLLLLLLFGTGGNRGGTIGFGVTIPWWQYLLTQFPAVAQYLRLSLWPHPLVLDYGAAWAQGPGDVLPFVPVVAILVGGTAYALWRYPRAGFLGCWFLAILAPTSSVVPGIRQTVAEHRMYLPLAAVIVALVLVVQRLTARAPFGRRLAGALAFAACLAAAAGTYARNHDYRSALAIWSQTAAERPGNAYAHLNLAFALSDAGRPAEAITELQLAVRLNPGLAEGHVTLGLALVAAGRLPEAVAEYERALLLRPDYPEGEFDLANALAQGRDLPGAIQHFQRALVLQPHFPAAHLNLGNAWLQAGRPEEAVREYREALRLQPDYADAQNNLAVALRALGAGGPRR